MAKVAHSSETNGQVVFDNLEYGILLVHYTGEVPLSFVMKSADYIIDEIEKGLRRVLYSVGDSTPLFSPVDLLDEFRRVGRAGGKKARFAYLAPENMFTKHFMLIEAAAYNEGIEVRFFSDKAEAKSWLTDTS